MSGATVQWPAWKKIVNEAFIPLVHNRDRYLIMYGGRGSGKSDFTAKLLIFRALTEPYFRIILARKHYASVRNSQFQTLKDIVYSLGLGNLFDFRQQPMEIECRNGNKFIAAGCDEPQKLKSIKDPTGVWYEEDIISEDDWITITTSIRTPDVKLQEIFTINPEVEGNFEDNWFWRRFFSQNRESLSFRTEVGGHGVTVHQSTYRDNRWLPESYKKFLENMKHTNPYYYTVYTEGQWGNKIIGGRFYREFTLERNVKENLEYNPNVPLHISFDFNTKPYMALTIAQVSFNKLRIIDEICATEPENNTAGITKIFAKRYITHNAGLYIYGDPSGKRIDTRHTQPVSDYTIIAKYLEYFKPTLRVDSKAPPVVTRGQFINEIFMGGLVGRTNLSILVDKKCSYLIDDLLYTKEMSDGGKYPERGRDEDGISVEKRGHFSDTLDYMVCRMFKDHWNKFKSGSGNFQSFEYIVGSDKEYSFSHW